MLELWALLLPSPLFFGNRLLYSHGYILTILNQVKN